MATILPRSTWTSTRAGGSAMSMSRQRGIVVHYPAAGKDVGVLSLAQEASRLRGWRNYHVSGRGWADLGYNWAIGQSGRIHTGRGFRVGAHATGHNSTTTGVLFIVGDNEPLTKEAKQAFKALRAYLRKKGVGAGVWGHQQMSGASTRCPGPYIMGSIRDGSLAAGTGGSTGGGGAAKPSKPSKPAPSKPKGNVPGPTYTFPYESKGYIGPRSGPSRSHSGIGGRKTGGVLDSTHNKRFVSQLGKRGWNISKGGPYLTRFGNDGKYGDELAGLIGAFQRDQGLTVDKLAGKSTWDAAFKNPVT